MKRCEWILFKRLLKVLKRTDSRLKTGLSSFKRSFLSLKREKHYIIINPNYLLMKTKRQMDKKVVRKKT